VEGSGAARLHVDDALSPDFPLGVEREVLIGRNDAERRACAY
jgi:hypothetical protein